MAEHLRKKQEQQQSKRGSESNSGAVADAQPEGGAGGRGVCVWVLVTCVLKVIGSVLSIAQYQFNSFVSDLGKVGLKR
jgi:hypothetical protein